MTNRQRIEKMVAELAEATKKPYDTDFNSCYGGWNLYYQSESGGHSRGTFGFDYRLSTKEMIAYMNGVLKGLAYKNNP